MSNESPVTAPTILRQGKAGIESLHCRMTFSVNRAQRRDRGPTPAVRRCCGSQISDV